MTASFKRVKIPMPEKSDSHKLNKNTAEVKSFTVFKHRFKNKKNITGKKVIGRADE